MEIFKSEPSGWGLRGDPEFWKQLGERFEKFDDPKNEIKFGKKLDFEFNELLKKGEKKSDDIIWFEEFSQQGMSGGSVSIVWWIKRGLPLLKERYAKTLYPNRQQ